MFSATATRLTAAEIISAVGLAVLTAVAIYLGKVALLLLAVAAVAVMVAIFVRPMLGLGLAIALMPLEAQGRLIASQPALTWAKVVLVLLLLVVVVRALVEHQRLSFPPRAWALFGMPFALVAGSIAGGYRVTFETVKVEASVLFLVVMVVCAYWLVCSESDFVLGVLAVIAGSVPVVAFGLVEVMTKEALFPNPMFDERLWAPGTINIFRITSTFYDPNVFGRYLCFASLWTLAALSLPKLKRWRPLMLVVLAAQLFCLVNTFSRAALATIVAVGGIYLVYFSAKRWKVWGLIGVSAVAAVAYTAVAPLVTITLERFSSDRTAGGRIDIYREALPVLMRSPLFGYGREHLPQALAKTVGVEIDPHNMYLEVLLATGVVGAILGLSWMAPLVRDLWRHARKGSAYAIVVLLPLFGVLFFDMSLHGMDGYEIWIPLAFGLPALRLASDLGVAR